MLNIDELLNELTLEEKVCLLSGHKSWHSNKVSRLNIPSIFITDGPHGLRKKKEDSKEMGLGQTELSTCFPAACTTASSWNKSYLYEMGQAMGKECNYYDVNVILGPAVNIKRNPLCGRNFEYFSEDPYLAGMLGANLTKGIESRGVATSVKHFACNNNEGNRYFGDSIVDDRAFHEIYLKVFEHIIKKGKPQTVMCSYNRVNGEYASENQELLTDILREQWGFDGIVMSDWGAVNDRVKGLVAGLDLEMPGDISHNWQMIYDAVKNGTISEEIVNQSVRRILTLIKNTIENKLEACECFEENNELSSKISADGAILLKNRNNILPINKTRKYLVIGEMFEKMRYQGAGSSLIRPYKLTQPIDAFRQNGIDFEYYQGYCLNSFDNEKNLLDEAINASKEYDEILFFGGLSEEAESEGFDRKTLSLPSNQLKLIEALISHGKKIIFIMYGGSPVDLSFIDDIDALLHMYLPGQSGGKSTFDLLFGNISPSGRLAETWPLSYNDVPFGNELTKTTNDIYKESIFVGYRYYNTFNIPVRFPFGYGLSYGNVDYKSLEVRKVENGYIVEVTVENSSDIPLSEVIELFVNAPKNLNIKPLRELKCFEKVFLNPKESKTVELFLEIDDLKYRNNEHWILENGEYILEICKDVNNVILSESITIDYGIVPLIDSEYNKLYNFSETLLNISEKDYEQILGYHITLEEIKKPYNLNTPLKEYKTFFGKLIFKVMTKALGLNYKMKLKAKNTPDKETKVKNAYFTYMTIYSMSLRSMSYASEGMLSHRMALGLLDIANNKPLRGLWKIITKEKCIKLPK